MDWTSKKFNYKFINQRGEVVATLYDYLTEIESFAVKSSFEITCLTRTGKDDFTVNIRVSDDWKIK